MTAYCQTCGAARSACSCARSRSTMLEALGFTNSTSSPARRRRADAPPAPPVPTSVSTAVPVRSTTALVDELWHEEEDLGEFPPPVAPAIAARPARWGALRVLATVAVLAAIGIGAHFGTLRFLDLRTESLSGEAADALGTARVTAAEAVAAAEAIADPDADTVALSGASTTISSLEADARAFTAIADPPPTWLQQIGIELDDPIAGLRGPFGVAAIQAATVADELSAALTTRLLVADLPALPDLPSGADDGTIATIETELTSSIAALEAELDRYDADLAEQVRPLVEAWSLATNDYVAALRSHDAEAESLAEAVTTAHAAIEPVTRAWTAGLGDALLRSTGDYRAAIDSMG